MAIRARTFDQGAVIRRTHGYDARVEVQATLNFAPDEGGHQHHTITDQPVRLWVTPQDLHLLRAQGTRVNIGPHPGSMVPEVRKPRPVAKPSSPHSAVPGRVTISLHLEAAESGRQFIPGWGLRATRRVVVY